MLAALFSVMLKSHEENTFLTKLADMSCSISMSLFLYSTMTLARQGDIHYSLGILLFLQCRTYISPHANMTLGVVMSGWQDD